MRIPFTIYAAALAVALAAVPAAVLAQAATGLRVAVSGSEAGAGTSLSLSRGDWRGMLTYSSAWDGASDRTLGFSFSSPFGALGSLYPAGLAAFVLRPHGLSYRLGLAGEAPLSGGSPGGAPFFGARFGREGGILAWWPSSSVDLLGGEPGPAAPVAGAWASPWGGALSLLLLGAEKPGDSGGPSWYDATAPASYGRWYAAGARMAYGPWRGALGLAASVSYPGGDAYAFRLENLVSVGKARLEALCGGSSGAWQGPAGAASPAFWLDVRASARLSSGLVRIAPSARYAESRKLLSDNAEKTLVFALEAGAGVLGALARVNLVLPKGGNPMDSTLAWKIQAGKTLCAAVFGSWKVLGDAPQRLDLGMSLSAGSASRQVLGVSAEGAWRAEPGGRYVRAGMSLLLKLHGGSLSLSAATDGWQETTGPGGAPSGKAFAWKAGLSYTATVGSVR